MLNFPNIDPVILELGPISLRWYGLMYAIGISIGWLIIRSTNRNKVLSTYEVDDLVTYVALGVILGGRLGYFLFYAPAYFLYNPLYIIQIYKPGMSFHGGLLGVTIGIASFCYINKKSFFAVSDLIALVVPIGLAFGRIGNFINGELWGRRSDLPWAMVFPGGGSIARHPSQLYEVILEGVLLFVLLWFYSRRKRATGSLSALFLIGYSCARIIAEFFREPDLNHGFYFSFFTMGQLLSIPMFLIGVLLFCHLRRKVQK